jgi:deferrochelatase/peroxidase EfeB
VLKKAMSVRIVSVKIHYESPTLYQNSDFGFMDGISQPAVKGFTATPTPGQTLIDPGHILLLESGDTVTRPPWAKDGSFLAFRQLRQLVPEFNQFLADNPISEPGLTPAEGSALLGARMLGRWKSVRTAAS